MSNNPFFSVIIPVYNVEKYIDECMQSVLNQTYKNFEVILVDDGSPDNCPKICDEYALKDNRVKVIHKENGGLSDARNYGIKNASGDYILFLDSDDFWSSNIFLDKVYNVLNTNDFDLLIFGMQKYYQNENRYGEKRVPCKIDAENYDRFNIITMLQKTNSFIASACDKVYKRSFIVNNNLEFVYRQLSEDIEWCAKLLLLQPNIVSLNESYYIYRQQNATSITNNVGRKNLQHIHDMIVKYAKIGKETNNIELLNYIANQYVLWLTVSSFVKDDISDLLHIMKGYKFLMKYNTYPYVHTVSKVKFLSVNCIRKLLKFYKSGGAKK